VLVRGPVPTVPLENLSRSQSTGDLELAIKSRREIFLPETAEFTTVPVYDRYTVPEGATFEGPAIIEERESTAVIIPGASVVVDSLNNLRIRLR
jgi:N-methylhydantoinase A/oxoprolinase/acetone carboxylase beta subunit